MLFFIVHACYDIFSLYWERRVAMLDSKLTYDYFANPKSLGETFSNNVSVMTLDDSGKFIFSSLPGLAALFCH